MKSISRKYTFRLYLGDARQAACNDKIEEILKQHVKKVRITEVIVEALCEYLGIMHKTAERINSTASSLQATSFAEVACKHQPSETGCIEEGSPTNIKSIEVLKDTEHITRSLINLAKSLPA